MQTPMDEEMRPVSNDIIESPLDVADSGNHSGGVHTELRDRLYYLFDGGYPPADAYAHPMWAKASHIIQYITSVMIVLSVIVFIVLSLPEYYDGVSPAWSAVEGVIIAYFVVDYTVRIATSRKRMDFVTKPTKIVDFIATFPSLLVVVNLVSSRRESSITSAFRLLRGLTLAKRSGVVRALWNSVLQASEGLQLLAYLVLICVTAFSTMMYYAERSFSTFDEKKRLWIRADGNVSPFQSIVHAMWWCVVSLTTTGYGDEVPISPIGKLIGGFTVVTGVLVLSFPTVVLGGSFQEALSKRRKDKEAQHQLQHQQQHSHEEGAMTPRAILSKITGIMRAESFFVPSNQSTGLARSSAGSPRLATNNSYRVPLPEGRHVVVSIHPDGVVEYDALLRIRRTMNACQVTPLHPTGFMVIMNLVLSEEDVVGAIQHFLASQNRMCSRECILPRPVSKVQISILCDPKWEIVLHTREYLHPVGMVPIVLQVPRGCTKGFPIEDMIANLRFNVIVSYTDVSEEI